MWQGTTSLQSAALPSACIAFREQRHNTKTAVPWLYVQKAQTNHGMPGWQVAGVDSMPVLCADAGGMLQGPSLHHR